MSRCALNQSGPTGQTTRNWAETPVPWQPIDVSEAQRVQERHWLEPWLVGLVLAAGLTVTLWRATPSPTWRDDLAVIRGLGLIPVGGEGVVSGFLIQLFALVPLGGRLFRAAAVGAVALAGSMGAVFHCVRSLVRPWGGHPATASVLAAAGAIMCGLSPSWQWEGTVAGGATLSAVLALLALMQAEQFQNDAGASFRLGLILGLGLLENRAVGLVTGLAVGLSLVPGRRFPPQRRLILVLAGGAITFALGLVPILLRVGSSREIFDLGFRLFQGSLFGAGQLGSGLVGLDASVPELAALNSSSGARQHAWDAWLRDLGPIPCGLALLGAYCSAWDVASRRRILPFGLFILADAVFPAARTGILSPDPVSGLRLVAVAGIAILGATGAEFLTRLVRQVALPYARPAAGLLLVFYLMITALAVEGSQVVADERAHSAAEAWTDEALGTLPPRSLVLVRSETAFLHLWAARVAHGDRPDVVIVPVPLLGIGALAGRLVQLEPALAGAVRDFAMEGRPSEFSLSTLADVRPLFVELDPQWDKRLFQHALPAGLWTRFSPHAVGSSDRVLTLEPARAPFERVAQVAGVGSFRDRATLAVIRNTAKDQLAVLRVLRDSRGQEVLDAWLARVEGADN